MKIGDRLQELNSRDPFLPFEIRRASGDVIRVQLPGEIRLFAGARWIFVAGEGMERIDLSSIVEVVDVGHRRESEGPMTIEKVDEFLKRRPCEPLSVVTAAGADCR